MPVEAVRLGRVPVHVGALPVGAPERLEGVLTDWTLQRLDGHIWILVAPSEEPQVFAGFDEEKTAKHGSTAPMQRPGGPDRVAEPLDVQRELCRGIGFPQVRPRTFGPDVRAPARPDTGGPQ